MGQEGLVSERGNRPYHGGRCPDWRKIKNRNPVSELPLWYGTAVDQGGDPYDQPIPT